VLDDAHNPVLASIKVDAAHELNFGLLFRTRNAPWVLDVIRTASACLTVE
jgi:hypothetical protein